MRTPSPWRFDVTGDRVPDDVAWQRTGGRQGNTRSTYKLWPCTLWSRVPRLNLLTTWCGFTRSMTMRSHLKTVAVKALANKLRFNDFSVNVSVKYFSLLYIFYVAYTSILVSPCVELGSCAWNKHWFLFDLIGKTWLYFFINFALVHSKVGRT